MEDDILFKKELRKAVDSKCSDSLLSLSNKTSHKTAILNFCENGKKLIHYAAEFGSVDLLKVLVGLGAYVQDTTSNDKNALHIACEEGNEDIVDYLLKTVSDSSFKTALTTSWDTTNLKDVFYYAALSGKINIVRCLENDRNLNIDEVFPNKSTALYTLVKENQYDAANLLCQCGADVNIGFEEQNFRPIHFLAQREDGADMLKLLLKYGANVNENWGNPPYGHQPLFIALKHKCSENAKILIEKGANVSFKGRVTKLGWINCFCLAAMNCPSLIQDFLKHGANPNEEYGGKSVLMIAFSEHVTREGIIALIKAGASKGRDGMTAIQCCKSFSQLELFIDAGITVEEIETRHGVSTLLSTFNNDVKRMQNQFPQLPISIAISKLLLVGANPNLAGEGEESALILAIKNGLFEAADELIQAGANVNHIGVDGNNAAHACCKSGPMAKKSTTMKALIDKGLFLNNQQPCGNYLFDLIVETWFDDSVLISMIEKGADPNLVKDRNNSVLMKCVQQKRFQVCCALIEGGADVSYMNENGETAFDIYAEMFPETNTVHFNHGESVSKLNLLNAFLATGIETNKLSLSGICPLMIAIWLRCADTVRLILKNGGHVNIMDNFYDTPLTTALEFDLEEIVNTLLNAKANVNHKGGETSLSSLVLNEEPSSAKHMRLSDCSESCFLQPRYVLQSSSGFKCRKTTLTRIITDMPGLSMDRREYYVSLLLDFGADPNMEESGSDSTLMHAVRLESPGLVRTLVEAGADVNHTGQMGLTALHVYFKSYHIKERSYSCYGDLYLLEILDALLAKKPNVNLKDNDGISPLQLAIRNQKTEAVEKLLFSNPIMPFEDSDKLEAFEMCLTIEPQVCLQILDVLSDHLNLANTVDVFFCKFWKYINTHDCSRNREVLDSVTYKILSTEEEVQVNLASDSEYSPLMYFCHFGCFQAVKMLLFHKADVNYVGMRGTILHELLDMTDDDNAVLLFDCLLKEQPKMNISDNMGKTVAEKAIDILCGKRSASSSMGYQYYSPMNERRFKNISLCFQKLLESGVTLDSKDLNDALLMCAEKSDFKGMKSLIRHGADFYRKDIIGNSIFHLCWLASLDGGLDFLRFFIESEHSLKRIDSVDNSILSSLLTFGGMREYGSVTNDKDISEISSFLIQNGACCVKDKEGNGPLHLAAKNGYLSTIGVLLKLDSVSLYDQNEKGDTAVHICLKHPKENICDVIKILLENNSAKLGLNLRNESVLYLAMVAGQRIRTNNVESVTYQLVKTLLRNEADPNEHSRDHIPLFVALETGDVMTSKLLLNASANINATNRRGKCSLHIIYENTWATDSKLSLTQLLLENGLNVNLVDESGKSALFSLVNRYTGHYFTDSDVNSFEEIFNVLLKYGADLNLSDKLDETVLSYICSSGRNVEIGYILLKSGASPKKGCCLQNLLESLQIYGNKSCFLSLISSLLQKGADPNRRRIEGSNIIDCIKNGNILLVEEFIKYGADVNGCDNFKKTALHYACNIGYSKDRYAITTLLVKHGSNLNVASILGERPLDIVVENMIKEMTNAAFFSRANNCGTYTVDLSLLNVLVCGGADLCPVITDTIEQFYESSSFTVHATPLNYRNRNKSALYLLISNGLFQTAEYLLRSGWDVEKEEWFDAFDVSKLDLIENNTMNYSIYKRHDVMAKKAEFKSFLQTVDKGPKLLTTICRKLIRQQLLLVPNGSEIETKISTLPLPEKIKRFLSLKECILENEIIQFE